MLNSYSPPLLCLLKKEIDVSYLALGQKKKITLDGRHMGLAGGNCSPINVCTIFRLSLIWCMD